MKALKEKKAGNFFYKKKKQIEKQSLIFSFDLLKSSKNREKKNGNNETYGETETTQIRMHCFYNELLIF